MKNHKECNLFLSTNFIQNKGKVKKIYEINQIGVYMNSYIAVK